MTLICLLVGKHSDRQAGLKSTKFCLDLYYHWTPARGWGNGRLKAEGRAEGHGEMGSLQKSKRENRGLKNRGCTLKPGRWEGKRAVNLPLMPTYPLQGLLPKAHRRYFVLQAFAGPCVSELLCFFRADPWISPCCWGWSRLGCPGCLHLLLLPLCIMAGEGGYAILLDFGWYLICLLGFALSCGERSL